MAYEKSPGTRGGDDGLDERMSARGTGREVRGVTPCAVRGRKVWEADGKGKKKSAGVPRFCGLYCVLWGLQRSADRVQGDDRRKEQA